MSEYEPPAEVVEAMAKELHEVGYRAYGADYPYRDASPSWMSMMRAEARFVLRRQHERENPLLALLAGARPTIGKTDVLINDRERIAVLAAHAKLDAPKVPTLLEAVEQIERECPGRVITTLKDSQAWTIIKLAAVERAEKSG